MLGISSENNRMSVLLQSVFVALIKYSMFYPTDSVASTKIPNVCGKRINAAEDIGVYTERAVLGRKCVIRDLFMQRERWDINLY